ncbi:MAG: flavodoxin-dependent (E)-4-hydroxy-3-methylbut-2-enyl-diphosphate synthase, partial [Oceanidesulfovibrio sp.]
MSQHQATRQAVDPYRPPRRQTRIIHVGDVPLGSGRPVVVQSMTNTDTRDAEATMAQIRELADAGAALVRCAVPDMKAAEALRAIREESPVPLIADIHFDHKLALAALEAGAQGLRINPGHIGSEAKVDAV